MYLYRFIYFNQSALLRLQLHTQYSVISRNTSLSSSSSTNAKKSSSIDHFGRRTRTTPPPSSDFHCFNREEEKFHVIAEESSRAGRMCDVIVLEEELGEGFVWLLGMNEWRQLTDLHK